MGSEDLDMAGGGPSQRVDIGLNSLSGRVVQQQDQFSRNMPGPKRPDAVKKPRPGEAFGDYSDPQKFIGRERPGFLQSAADRDYREGGGAEGFHLEHRLQHKDSGQDEDERKNMYGGNQITGLGMGRDQDWGGGGGGDSRGVGPEGDYRDMGVRGDVSEVSQSEGTEEEDDDDGDMNGQGEGGVVGDRSRDMVLGERAIPHPQMTSMETRMRQDSSVESRGGVEGFQRSGSDRDRGVKGPSNSSPSFGLYLQPSSQAAGLQFIQYSSQSQPGGQMASHVDANAAQNGGMGGAGGVGQGIPGAYGMRGVETGISRDSYAKGVAARDNSMGTSLHDQQQSQGQQGQQGHSLHENLQSSEENYYTSLLNSTGSNNSVQKGHHDMRNDVGSPGQKRNSRMMEPPMAVERSLRSILSDPVSGQLMEDATIFTCGHSFGGIGLQQVIASNICITCGTAVRTTSMAVNYAIRAAVQAYKREEESFPSVAKPVKRRRDRPEQDGMSDRQPSDGNRSKGVQFPFVVTDRVLIKGNKRTPERFVGREAVITNQCLNGWYLVRTLDNGESVRLQYRSLQKLGVINGREFTRAYFIALMYGMCNHGRCWLEMLKQEHVVGKACEFMCRWILNEGFN